MCVAVTVLSMRTRSPRSTPAPRAASSSARLIRSHVRADTAPTVACSADLPGTPPPARRAKRRADSESRSANSRPRYVSRRMCTSTAQRSTVSQLRPCRPGPRPSSAPRSAATSAASSGCPSSHAEARSRSSATGWSTVSGSNRLLCVVRILRVATSGVLGFPCFCWQTRTRVAETPVPSHLGDRFPQSDQCVRNFRTRTS